MAIGEQAVSDLSRLGSYLSSREEADRFAGVVRISRGGSVLFEEAYGLANRGWGVANTIDTRFDCASVTKLFTTVAALQLVEQGALSLDTSPATLLGPVASSVNPAVRLGHLLTHTSGLADDADEEAGEVYADLFRDRPNYMVRRITDQLPFFVDRPPNFEPGQGCRYCNSGFVWAGMMIEKVTGTPYREWVTEKVFAPAGMTGSGFFSMDVVEPRVAEGADFVDGQWVRNIYSYPPIGSPDGGAHVTAVDLDRFFTAIHGHVLLTPETTKTLLTPQVEHHTDEWGTVRYGYGLEFSYDLGGTLMFYEKEGINAGVSAVVRHYPGMDTTLVMLSNMEDGIWEPREHIHSLIWEV